MPACNGRSFTCARLEQINLVLDEPSWRVALQRWRLRTRSAFDRYVNDPQHQIGFSRACVRTAYALLLHRLDAVANARRIQDGHRIAVELEMDLDHIARGAGERRNDRCLAPRQPVQQCRLAGIRRPGNGNDETVAQPLAAAA